MEWQLRFFVLENIGDFLRTVKIGYYEDETMSRRKGTIDLGNIEKVGRGPDGNIWERTGAGWAIGLYPKEKDGRIWYLKAPNKNIADEWCSRIAAFIPKSVDVSPFFERHSYELRLLLGISSSSKGCKKQQSLV